MNLGFRLYDPVIGRFLSVDPLFEMQVGINPYHYCGNDPVNGKDPSGLCSYFDENGGFHTVSDANIVVYGTMLETKKDNSNQENTYVPYTSYDGDSGGLTGSEHGIRGDATIVNHGSKNGGITFELNGSPIIRIRDGSIDWKSINIENSGLTVDISHGYSLCETLDYTSFNDVGLETPGDPEVGWGVEISGEFTFCGGANLSFIAMTFTRGEDAGNWYYYFQPTATFGINSGVSASIFWAFSSSPSDVTHTSPLGNHFNGGLSCGQLAFSTSFSYSKEETLFQALFSGNLHKFYTIGIGGGLGAGASFGVGETTGGIRIW